MGGKRRAAHKPENHSKQRLGQAASAHVLVSSSEVLGFSSALYVCLSDAALPYRPTPSFLLCNNCMHRPQPLLGQRFVTFQHCLLTIAWSNLTGRCATGGCIYQVSPRLCCGLPYSGLNIETNLHVKEIVLPLAGLGGHNPAVLPPFRPPPSSLPPPPTKIENKISLSESH